MKKNGYSKLISFFQGTMVVLVASLFVVSIVYAATTIGTNISTDGTLTVTGETHYTGAVFATSTVFIDGLVTADRITSTSATSSAYMSIGSGLAAIPGFDYSGDLGVSDDVYIGGTATTIAALWVGTGNADNLNLTGGDLYVQDDLEVDSVIYLQNNETISNSVNGLIELGGIASTTGDLWVSGGTFDLTTSTATTTEGIFSRDNTATSTVSVGDITDGATRKSVGCIELAASDGAYYSCFIDTTTPSLVCVSGRCN